MDSRLEARITGVSLAIVYFTCLLFAAVSL
jgi:hypothetical protein